MNLLIISFALFDIYCGTRLLAKTKSEALGRLYHSVAVFIITVGFLVLGVSAFRGIVHFRERSEQRYFQKEYSEYRNSGMDCDHTCFRNPYTGIDDSLVNEMIGNSRFSKHMHNNEFTENNMPWCHHHYYCCKKHDSIINKCCKKEGCEIDSKKDSAEHSWHHKEARSR